MTLWLWRANEPGFKQMSLYLGGTKKTKNAAKCTLWNSSISHWMSICRNKNIWQKPFQLAEMPRKWNPAPTHSHFSCSFYHVLRTITRYKVWRRDKTRLRLRSFVCRGGAKFSLGCWWMLAFAAFLVHFVSLPRANHPSWNWNAVICSSGPNFFFYIHKNIYANSTILYKHINKGKLCSYCTHCNPVLEVCL